MKFGEIQLYFHKHKWEQQFEEFASFGSGWEVKIYKKCVTPNCKLGYYKDVQWISCKDKPNVISVT